MAHALAGFIQQQMDERGLRNRDVVVASGLSRALVSKYVIDKRDTLTRLPDKATIEGFAKALGVSPEFLLAKAIESLGLGYTSGDFINSVASASDRQLLLEIEERLRKRGEGRADGSAPNTPPDSGPVPHKKFRKLEPFEVDIAALERDDDDGRKSGPAT